jgi:hypothetical protein
MDALRPICNINVTDANGLRFSMYCKGGGENGWILPSSCIKTFVLGICDEIHCPYRMILDTGSWMRDARYSSLDIAAYAKTEIIEHPVSGNQYPETSIKKSSSIPQECSSHANSHERFNESIEEQSSALMLSPVF